MILLNGASSSGKSTLAKALQRALDEPFLHVSSDQFVAAGMLPDPRDGSGPFAWWTQMRPRFFAGFHRCLPALADTGNDLIVEHVIEFPTWRDELSRLLAHLDVFLIGVHCDLDELDRRERSRGDRQIGEGRSHVEENLIHSFGPYDLEVDTTAGVSTTLTQSILRPGATEPHHTPCPQHRQRNKAAFTAASIRKRARPAGSCATSAGIMGGRR